MQLKLFSYTAAIFLTTMALTAWAANPANISISTAPENPAPEESVRITLGSYVNDLDSVSISWKIDGKTAASGIGLKTFNVSAPGPGREIRVSATLDFPDGAVEKVVVIRPVAMVLLWQANDSYVPPFYRGKALPLAESEIKIVAIPEIRNASQVVNPKNLVYAWKKDYVNDPSASGYGKNFYLFVNDYLDDANSIQVTASTTDGKYSGASDMNVQIFDPKILFYKNNTSLGTIWEHALPNGYQISGEEIIEAAPYFITPGDIRIPSLTWDWSINDTYVSVTGKKNVLPVQAQSGTSGTSKIRLEINNKYNLLTSATKELVVQF